VLVLLMIGIYDVCHSDGLRWRNVHTIFHDDRFKHSSNIKETTSTM
jgi:hypothetical protein